MRKSLVAFDTNHIKSYVFGTDRLKEIRGASALLDELNRKDMLEMTKQFCREKGIERGPRDIIYLNGGSGLVLLMTDENTAKEFGKRVQKRCQEATHGGIWVTYAVYELAKDRPDDRAVLLNMDLRAEFEILHYRLREAKANLSDLDVITLPSHPFIRSCDSCGINYAEYKEAGYNDQEDVDTSDDLGHYCAVCHVKQRQDNNVKRWLRKSSQKNLKGGTVKNFLFQQKITDLTVNQAGLWQRILFYLNQGGYNFNLKLSGNLPERPNDFNAFRNFVQGKEYLGLIYADANNMGIRLEKLKTLNERAEVAAEVDKAIHVAVSTAITTHLPLVRSLENGTLYPFDILLLGGDDIVMATDASKAMDVAYTIAKEFYAFTDASDIIDTKEIACTLSIGVVLAPIKYPFSLLLDMAEDTLKAAKKASLEARIRAKGKVDDSRINFVVATGGSIKDFDSVDKDYKSTDSKNNDFYATLRPYDLDGLERLLTTIKEGHKRHLGRTKLHALREAVLEKNLTTSVSHGLAVLRNWHPEQRDFVMKSLYEFGIHSMPNSNIKDPINGFPRVTFPWFVDPQGNHKTEKKAIGEVYRTAFLDFVELFDFVGID